MDRDGKATLLIIDLKGIELDEDKLDILVDDLAWALKEKLRNLQLADSFVELARKRVIDWARNQESLEGRFEKRGAVIEAQLEEAKRLV